MTNMHAFQFTCVAIAFISWLLMTYSGRNIKVSVDRTDADRATLKDGMYWFKVIMIINAILVVAFPYTEYYCGIPLSLSMFESSVSDYHLVHLYLNPLCQTTT